VRLDAARLAYNALLREALRRADLVLESRDFDRARREPRGPKRTAALKAIDARLRFRRYDLYYWANRKINRSWLATHLDAQSVRSLAARAYFAARKYQLGQGGRPRLLRSGQLRSVEGQSRRQGIRIRGAEFVWGTFTCPLAIDMDDAYVRHALAADVRRVRLVRRRLGRRERYFAVLVCAGSPLLEPRAPLGHTPVGLDPGPRVFGIALGNVVALVDLASHGQFAVVSRRLERSVNRKLKLGNPANFEPSGAWRQRPSRWYRSGHVIRDLRRNADIRRREAAARKAARGWLINTLLRVASQVYIESNSYRHFRKVFGRSSNRAAPGAFASQLAERCSQRGTRLWVVPTSLRLSRTCHGCGNSVVKSLSTRMHICTCGVSVQRDMYSAWLATFAVADPSGSSWGLDVDRARHAWSGAGLRLPAASRPLSIHEFVSMVEAEAANGRLGSVSLSSRDDGIERLAGVVTKPSDDARDVVGPAEGPGKSSVRSPRRMSRDTRAPRVRSTAVMRRRPCSGTRSKRGRHVGTA
jgi:putative transposase